MSTWWTKGHRLVPRKAREILKMNAWGSKLSPITIALVSILLSVQFIGIAKGQCSSQCTQPVGPNEIGGGGTPSFFPNQTCYDDDSYVNVTCSGYLFGNNIIGPCTDSYWEINYAYPTCEESSCSAATAPVDGSVSPIDSNTLYDEIEYSCDEGRFLDGPSMAVCTGTGEWSPSMVPTCSGNCTLPILTNGDASSSDDILQEGSQVTITCSDGYTLTGVANVTCHDEEWNPDVGECLENCPSPDIINSDFANYQEETDHGDYVIVTCDEGFTSGTGENVSEPLTCGNGTWDGDIYCYANCLTISAPDDGSINSASEPFYHGRVVAFNCSLGYTLVGDTNSTCDDGNWTNAVPECKADCLLPYVENSNLNDTTNSTYITHNSNKTVTCKSGFTFGYESEFDGVLACDDGSLDDAGFQCLESCDGPFVGNSNWANRIETVPYGGSIVVECDNDFSSGSGSKQNETLVCGGGSWNESVYCYANCPNISPPDGGNMYPNSATFYHINTVFFNCSETYLFEGESNLSCDNGTWSDPVPECKASCSGPDVENSNYANSTELKQHGEFVVVTCDNGFTSGSGAEIDEIVSCNDGSFNRTVYCYENCPNVTSFENGFIYENEPPHFYGDSVNFTCFTNYTLDGNETVTCLDGEWSSSFPECKADCTDPGTPINGTQTANSSYVHDGRVFFECDAGLDTLGSSVITCDNGTWSDPIPVCAEKALVDQITLSCAYDSFTVHVPYALLDGLKPDELVLENDVNCTGVNGTLGFVNITSKLGDCGTVLTQEIVSEDDETYYYDVYKNRVIAYSPTGVLYGPSVDLPLTCTYNRKETVNAVSYQLQNYTISRSLTDDGTYQFQFSVFEDDTFGPVVDTGIVYVDLDQDVFFGISLLGGGSELRVTAQTCWATPSSSSLDMTRWDLVENGCPAESSVIFYQDLTRALFSLTSFRFLNEGDSVYIHCDVLVCEQQADCKEPWTDECNVGRRRRRSAAHIGPNREKRLRVGPIARIDSVYQRFVLPEFPRQEESTSSVPGSLTLYVTVIASLAGVCLVLIASLSFVTTKLLLMGKK